MKFVVDTSLISSLGLKASVVYGFFKCQRNFCDIRIARPVRIMRLHIHVLKSRIILDLIITIAFLIVVGIVDMVMLAESLYNYVRL